MGEILTAQDLNSTVMVNGQPKPAGLGGDLKDLNANMQEFQKFAETVNSILDKIMAMRNAKAQLMGAQSQTVENSQKQEVRIKEVVVDRPVIKKINKQRLKAFIDDLLINQASKLPEDLQNMPIKALIGSNAKSFKYSYLGVELDYDQIMSIITVQLAEQIDKINEGD